jgi:hypothetical protein
VAEPDGFVLFIIPSVLVSMAITPILLPISPTPAFDSTKPVIPQIADESLLVLWA